MDYSILGSILGSLYFGKLLSRTCSLQDADLSCIAPKVYEGL